MHVAEPRTVQLMLSFHVYFSVAIVVSDYFAHVL